MNLESTPFVKLLIPLLAGIIIALNVADHPIPYLIGSIIILCFYLWFNAKRKGPFSRQFGWIWGAYIHIAILLFSYGWTNQWVYLSDSQHFSNFQQSNTRLIAKIAEPLEEKARSYKTIIQAQSLLTDQYQKDCNGKAIVYFAKDSLSQQLKYGDLIIIQSPINETSAPANNYEFNFQSYLQSQGIYHQQYLKSGAWIPTTINHANPLMKWVYQTRSNYINTLKILLPPDEMAIASALVLGDKSYLEQDTKAMYAETGAMHVLAVSGLHVGIIVLFFSFLLSFLDRLKRGKILKVILLLMIIWAFALLTGLAPSVCRAATMFSFLCLGNAFNQHTNIYNTLAASAFCLLLINPLFIQQLGFQLSYIAVISIIYLQPKISELMSFKHPIAQHLWDMSAVSIAAQIGTLPLSLYCFGQFPTYFWLSNFFVIYMAWLILTLGLITFIFSYINFNFLIPFLGQLLHALIYCMNYSLEAILQLPYAVLKSDAINFIEMFFLYASILLLIAFNIKKHYPFLRNALFLLVGFSCYHVFTQLDYFQESSIAIYQVNKASLLAFKNGHHVQLFQASEDSSQFYRQYNQLADYYQSKGIQDLNLHHLESNLNTPHFYKTGPFIQFQQQSIGILDTVFAATIKEQASMDLDLLVVSQNIQPKYLFRSNDFCFKQCILDGSNHYYTAKKWAKYCRERAIPFHYTKQDGAFQLNL